MKMSLSREIAATTPSDLIKPGSPEEAYQAINRAKMLWNFRKRDVNSWSEVIDKWAAEPKAWKRIPEIKPYGTARNMIEAEVCEDYDAFVAFVQAVLGSDYAAKIVDNHADRPGPKEGTVNNPSGNNQHGKTEDNSYAYNYYPDDKESSRGTRSTYLLERIAKEHPAETENIGKGKRYKTVNEAARNLGIVADRERLCFYADDPAAAGQYLAKRVDAEWMAAMLEAYQNQAGEET